MNTEIAIKENDLELVVSEKKLGSLTTNAKQIRDMVKNALPKYDISYYNEENISQAKRDKASLNKAAKALNEKRIEIEREFMKPFGEFKEVIGETVQLISQCSSKIDSVVKQSELLYKEEKKREIENCFNELNVNLVDFKKVFKEAWLNKSASMKSVCTDMENILSGIEKDIQTIESMSEDVEVLRTYYMDTLDINNTIRYSNRLKVQRLRARAEELVREQNANADINATINSTNEVNNEVNNEVTNDNLKNISEVNMEVIPAQKEIYIRAFKVTTTRENIIALGNFMNERGIAFEKIELP